MDTQIFDLTIRSREAVDVTHFVTKFCAGRGNGLLHAFVPHATAGLAIIETGAGSDTDLMSAIDELLPRDDRYVHRHGSHGHGADHVLPAFICPSVTLPVFDGLPAFGTWQRLVFVDPNSDNPERQLRLSFVSA